MAPKRKRTEDTDSNSDGDAGPDRPQSPTLSFKIGDKVSAMWTGKQSYGQYFPGTICKINTSKETMEIEFEDGYYDNKVPWKHVVIV